MLATTASEEVVAPSSRPPQRSTWPDHWPLTVALLGFPLWWALGISVLMPMLMAGVMGAQLLRQRQLFVPAGFGWWLLFLVWVVLGIFTLWADAPGAVLGGGMSRLLVFGYRLAWYTTCTIILVWATNSDTRQLTIRRSSQLFGYLFIVTVAGGLLGVLAPTLEFRSLFEIILPNGIASNSLVQSIVHPGVADVQTFLGHPVARPKAPFDFANSWGSNFSLYLPFFLAAVVQSRRLWQRVAGLGILAISTIPVVYSLNRGLWGSLALGLAFLIVRQIVKGKIVAIMTTGVALAIASFLFLASPLSGLTSERLANEHSNDRRGQLLVQTVDSAMSGSPILGFGSTRDVQGSFASIAGASTPDCPACGVPPLGTQGHIWTVIFSQGFPGAFFFLAFFLTSFFESWRCHTTIQAICTVLLLFFGVQMFIYDTLGMPLVAIMFTIGLVSRDQQLKRSDGALVGASPTVQRLFRRVRDAAPMFAVFVVLGAVTGAIATANAPQIYSVHNAILVAPSPVYLDTEPDSDEKSQPRDITLDTEAALIFSAALLREVEVVIGKGDETSLRNTIRVTAIPNTRVINLEVREKDPEKAERTVQVLSQGYLKVRRSYLDERRRDVLAGLDKRLLSLDTATDSKPGGIESGTALQRQRNVIDQAINNIALTSTSAGEVIRHGEVAPVRKAYGVKIASAAAVGLIVGAAIFALTQREYRGFGVRSKRRRRRK